MSSRERAVLSLELGEQLLLAGGGLGGPLLELGDPRRLGVDPLGDQRRLVLGGVDLRLEVGLGGAREGAGQRRAAPATAAATPILSSGSHLLPAPSGACGVSWRARAEGVALRVWRFAPGGSVPPLGPPLPACGRDSARFEPETLADAQASTRGSPWPPGSRLAATDRAAARASGRARRQPRASPRPDRRSPTSRRIATICSAAGEREAASRVTAQTRRTGVAPRISRSSTPGCSPASSGSSGHAEAGGDEALEHLVVVALEGDLRLEAGVRVRSRGRARGRSSGRRRRASPPRRAPRA